MEVVAAVGGGLVSASIESLFEKLASGELLKFAREEQMLADLKNWENMLIKINALLDDAEEKQMTDRGLKIWLDELRDLAYDIEDVLDEFSSEALKLKVMGDSKKNTIKLPTCFTGLTPASFAFKRRMASKTNDITSRLQRITEQEQTLNLTKIARRERSNKLKERPPTSSLIQESHTYGRKDDNEAIVRKLLTDEVGDNPVRVIPILGMGGIGKTTLAQLVYNDPRVKACFEIKLWVCVSENFDVVALTRTILQAVIGKIRDSGDLDLNDLNNFDVLQEKLKAKLSHKKFLLVLDDVWEEDYSQWDLLRRPFDAGAPGSKIVITTRNECVASITSTDSSAYHVKVLPDTECLSVLALHALGAPNFDAHLDLKDIGEKIVKRCKGLPLAAKVLGGLLRSSKSSRDEWEGILRSEMWSLLETSNSILLALKLSYHYLPCYLKRCFVYCAIFPKDYEFDREELVSLWMAEGFLQHPRGKKLTEDVGIKYFNDLLSRSFFQSSSRMHSRFVMHDLISDLAQSIAGEICYCYENNSEDSMLSSKYEKVRHASLILFEKYDSQEYDVFAQMNSLRSIVGLPIPGRDQVISRPCGYGKYEYKKVLDKILPKAKSVRVLSLTSPAIFVMPDSIGDLKHIRHLNLSHTSIERLPDSVSFLFNLQALILYNCFNLNELPRKIGNLVNLQLLDIYDTPKLREIPSEIGKLTNLQKLSNFIVTKGDGNTITYLKNLLELRGSLSICGLHNVTDVQAARSANMKEKQNLEELVLEWTDHFFDPLVKADYDEQNGDNEVLVLQSIQPHQNLKRLTISFYGGSEFPSWMGHPMSSKLLCLNLRHCRRIKLLPPLGQFCFLKELSIDGLDGLETIGPEFYGSDLHSVEPFRSLETLEIKNMPEWREWSHFVGVERAEVRFPNLQRLVLQNCPKLIGNLPSRLPCGLTHIRLEDCDALESFPIVDNSSSKQCLLEELEIRNCYSLKYFDRNFNFPSSLTRLTIVNCRSLVFLPDGLMVDVGENDRKCHSHLEYLEISGCPLIPSFPSGKLPAALSELRIGGLTHLGSITREMFHENNLLERVEIWNNGDLRALPSISSMQNLRHLSIANCPALESFPKMGLAIPTLTYLAVQSCPNLLSLPKPELSHLPSLRTFIVSNCRGVVSLTEEAGLPPKLTTLQIRDCENLRQPMSEWGLHRLSSLEILQVDGIRDAVAHVVSFLDDGGCLLPTSLNALWMEDFMNLESISMGLQMLTSLKYLVIADCPKLQSFPKEAVPPGLIRINMCGCPLLKGDYLKLKNEEDRPTVEFFL